MIIFINKKEGWHEDEIFSYGSSNYKYDNLFQVYGKEDIVNETLKLEISEKGIWETIKEYIKDKEIFWDKYREIENTKTPIWKTKEEAIDYVTIQKEDVLNYMMVYYNQSRDVHPPLFYFLVHFVSTIYFGTFTKYIIFVINLAFFIGTLYIILKMLSLIDKQKLQIPTILFYGLSIGAISSVIFQRMYMMLTFFVINYLYINIKIYKNNYKLDKSMKRQLITNILLGFLTQYYFCFYALILFIVQNVFMIKQKRIDELKSYIFLHVKVAIIGIIIFPASIYHIFFSYRGIGNINDINILERLNAYIQYIFNSFSFYDIVGYILILIIIVLYMYKFSKNYIGYFFLIPALIYFIIISKISPYIEIRYIMPILPIIAIIIFQTIEDYIKNQKIQKLILVVFILIQVMGLIINKPYYLYKGYKEYVQLAKQNEELKLVYVGSNEFNHIKYIKEYMIYEKSLIINEEQLPILKEQVEFTDKQDFILRLDTNKDKGNIINEVLQYTGYSRYEELLENMYKIKY